MKALISLVFLVLIVGGGWYVFRTPPGDETTDPEPDQISSRQDPDSNPKPKPPAKQLEPAPPLNDAEKRRRLWSLLRPSRERLLPDPDGVGPCPPPEQGGDPGPVIRRYRDRETGCPTWVHANGAYTTFHPSHLGRDPATGEWLPGRPVVVRAAPTDPKPIAPGDLEAMRPARRDPGGKEASKEGSGKKQETKK